MQDLIIYEMHVRGFTQDSSSHVQHPGTYLGLIEKIPYLKELGINALEILPIHEFNENETIQIQPYTETKTLQLFWIFHRQFFFPNESLCNSIDGDQAIIEFKTMVRELHKNGIEVILDVVYNHTCESGEDGTHPKLLKDSVHLPIT